MSSHVATIKTIKMQREKMRREGGRESEREREKE